MDPVLVEEALGIAWCLWLLTVIVMFLVIPPLALRDTERGKSAPAEEESEWRGM